MLLQYWKNFRRRSAVVMKECREDIIQSNLSMLKKMSVVALVLLFGYSVVTAFMFKNQQLYLIYQVFLFIHAVFVLFAFWYAKQRRHSLAVTQGSCIAFILSIMMFITIISVVPYRQQPGIFFPILYITVYLLYLFPFWVINLVMTTVYTAFSAAVLLLKSPEAISYDLFGATTVWIIGICLSFWNIDLRLREYESKLELKNASNLDEMTGLPNRRYFNDFIAYKFKESARKSLPFSILIFDIDDFKYYNDSFGHLAGDECLSRIGRVMLDYMIQQDLFIARFGGEEFIAVLAGEDARRAQEHAENLIQQIRKCPMPAAFGESTHVTMSVGFAQMEHIGETASFHEVIKNADVALYRAKANGKDRIERFSLSRVVHTCPGSPKL